MKNKDEIVNYKQENIKQNEIQKIIYDISNGNKKIEDLTMEEKQSIYCLLNVELIKKEIKLKDLKNEIIYKDLEENKDIKKALNTMSERDKKNFLDFLNHKI